MSKENEIFYVIKDDLEMEYIDTNDNYLKSILTNVEKYYALPDNYKAIKIKNYLPLGNIAFYILDSQNLNFEPNIIEKIKLLNSFLSYCIKDKHYCNEKIFLTFVRYILKISELPKREIYTSISNNFYNINEANLDKNLDLILENFSNIKLEKIYICSDIVELIIVSILEILSKKYCIRKCKNCHKYFYNKNSNKYCSYASPQESKKSCFKYCANISYQEKRNNDPIRKKYNSISNMLRNRYRYKEEEIDRKILMDFEDAYRSEKNALNSGLISKEDMLEFLDESNKKFKEEYRRRRKKNGSTRNNKK